MMKGLRSFAPALLESGVQKDVSTSELREPQRTGTARLHTG